MMVRPLRRAAWLIGSMLLGATVAALASEGEFPFDHALMLEAAPMRGSKRIPILEIAEDGAASIQLWCASARGQATVTADAITIVPGAVESAQCTADRQNRDESLLAALAQVAGWRRQGDVIELLGATTLRFHLMTN